MREAGVSIDLEPNACAAVLLYSPAVRDRLDDRQAPPTPQTRPRARFRRQGIGYALARAAVDFARERGARALEAYPMIMEPGTSAISEELHVGTRSMFAAAGFTEVSRPTLRRVVMRIDY